MLERPENYGDNSNPILGALVLIGTIIFLLIKHC
jgi:phage gp45-like